MYLYLADILPCPFTSYRRYDSKKGAFHSPPHTSETGVQDLTDRWPELKLALQRNKTVSKKKSTVWVSSPVIS